MAFPLAIPVALSAIQALIRFRGRLDTILSLSEATAELPFILPPLPRDDTVHIDLMLTFFAEDEPGRAALEIKGLANDFAAVRTDPRSPALEGKRKRLLDLFYEFS